MRSANLEIVKVGIAANDGSGDPLRTAFVKINSNFSNIYANGRFLGNVTDSKISPGYSWPDAVRSGLYHLGIGEVGLAVDGQDGLVIRNTGTITFNGISLLPFGTRNTANVQTVATNSTGISTVTHSLGSTPNVVLLTPLSPSGNITVGLTSLGSSTFNFYTRIIDRDSADNGNLLKNSNVTISWLAYRA